MKHSHVVNRNSIFYELGLPWAASGQPYTQVPPLPAS